MIHVDIDYALMVTFASLFTLLFVALSWVQVVDCPDEEEQKRKVSARMIIFFAVMAAIGWASASYHSGSVYHPCVVSSFEKMDKVCK